MPNMKWRKKDADLLAREVKRFNDALRKMKTRKKYAGVELPDTVTVKGIRKEISSRSDFNREIAKLKRFWNPTARNIRTNKYGLKALNYVVKEMQYDVQRINRARRKIREDLMSRPTRTLVGETGVPRGEQPDIAGEFQDKYFNFEEQRPGRAFEMQKQAIEKQSGKGYAVSKYNTFYNNFIQAAENNLAMFGDNVIALIHQFTPEELTKIYYEWPDFDIRYLYTTEEVQTKAEVLTSIMETVLRERTAKQIPDAKRLPTDVFRDIAMATENGVDFTAAVNQRIAQLKPTKRKRT